MAHVEASITVNRPIAEVFAFVTDFSKAVQWQSGLIEAGVTSSGPVGVGSTFKWIASFAGQKMDTGGQLTVWDPPNQYGYKTTAGPVPGGGGFTFKAEGNSTLVKQYGDFEPGGFFKLAEGLIMKQIEGQFQESVKKLKQVVEAGG